MAGTLQLGGLISGLDTNAIVDALVDVERNKVRLVQQQQAAYNVRLSAYGELTGKLNDFKSAADKLNAIENFDLFKGSSSNSDAATISGSTGATPGNYSLLVYQKAGAEKLSSRSGALTTQLDNLLAVGQSAQIKINGVKFDIDDNDTARDLMLRINSAKTAKGESLGVKASLLKAGANDYRLVLASEKEGISGGITLSDESGSLLQDLGLITDAAGSKGNISQSAQFGSSLPIPQTGAMGATGVFSFTGTDHNGNAIQGSLDLTGKTTEDLLAYIEAAFHQSVSAAVDTAGNLTISDQTTGRSQFSINVTQSGNLGLDGPTLTEGVTGLSTVTVAQNAFFSINGISVESENNKADDQVEGITFNLLKADPSKEVTLSIERDYDAIKGIVQGFLDSYNGILDYVREKSAYDTTAKPTTDGETAQSSAGPFVADWTISRVKSDLRGVLNTQFSQWGPNLPNNALARIGIKSDSKTGKLEIDEDKFKKTFEKNFDDIVRVFSPYNSSSNTNISLGRFGKDTQSAAYKIEYVSDDQYRISADGGATWTNSNTRVAGSDIINWSAGPAKGLSMTIPRGNTENADFVFTKGIGQLMTEKLAAITDLHNGYIVTGQTIMQNQVKAFDVRIDDLNRGLDDYRERLVKQYSELEKSMSDLKNQGANLISALGSSS